MGGPLGVGKVKNCAPLLAVLFRDKTKRVNLKIFEGGGIQRDQPSDQVEPHQEGFPQLCAGVGLPREGLLQF